MYCSSFSGVFLGLHLYWAILLYQNFIHGFKASIKAAMDLLSIAILVQFCIVISLPSKQSSGKAAQGDSIMRTGGEGIKRNFTRRRVIVNHTDKIWAADLVEMQQFSKWLSASLIFRTNVESARLRVRGLPHHQQEMCLGLQYKKNSGYVAKR